MSTATESSKTRKGDTAPDFKDFSLAVHARYTELAKGELFVCDVAEPFEKYLSYFPAGSDPIFRTRTTHDCNCCKQFIRRLGVLAGIRDGKTVSVWDNLDLTGPYKEVADKMSELVRSSPVRTVFRTKERKYGTEYNYDSKTDDRYDHFYGEVSSLHYAADPETKRSEQEAIFQVLKRGVTELRLDHLNEVLDLIDSNALYRGEEHKPALLGFRELLQKFDGSDTYIWANLGNRSARFRNTAIGSLLVELAEGKDLENAVKSFESKVAPMNYKRPTSIITQKMVEQAIETLNGLGLGGAIYRRYARLSDVSVNDVLFVDNDSRAKMKDGVAMLLESSVKKSAPDVKKSTAITAEQFVKDVLPTAKSLELFLENRHVSNFVTLTGGDGPERLFKWDNNFAWSYDGDVTDSVKQRVKAAGGNIAAKLRVSLSWFNFDDLDLHAMTPRNGHVYYGNKCGVLDVDMNAGSGRTRNAVENLAFHQLLDGAYKIYVNQFARRESIDTGFAIEVEFAGQLHQYNYPKVVTGQVPCFTLMVKNGELVKIDSSIDGGNASIEKWGVKTETLVPAVAVLNSPNHWNGQSIGAKHLIFALRDCKNPNPVRGLYNEFLRPDLEKHRKVFEVLGAKTKAQPTEDQVSGVGFTSARGDTVTVVVDGRRSFTLSF